MSVTESAGRGPAERGTTDGSATGDVRALPGGVAAVAVGALLWVVGGPPGLVGGGVLFVAWAVLPATYAFAVGQVVFVAVTRPAGVLEAGLLPLALVELGLAVVLVAPNLQSGRIRRSAAWILLGGSVLVGVALGSYTLWDRVWVAATVLVGIGAIGAYGLHRYELVVLGKVADPDDEDGARPEEADTGVAREPDRSDDEPAPDDELTPDDEPTPDDESTLEEERLDSYGTGGTDPDADGGETA